MDSIIQDKIDRYLLGRMSEEERNAFEVEMKADKELKRQYLFTKALKQEVSEHARLKEQMRQWDEEKEQENENEEPVALTSNKKWMYVVASLAAAILVAVFFLHGPFVPTGGTDGPAIIVRGGDSSFNKDVDSLLENKEYQQALDLINAKEEESEKLVSYYENYSNNEVDEEGDDGLTPEEVQDALKKEQADLVEYKLLKAQTLVLLGEKEKAAAILKELLLEDHLRKETMKELLKQTK